MAVSDNKSIWNIIDEFGLNIYYDSISDEIKCVICKKLLNDATISTICGCSYCYNCINYYINNEDKYCPAGKEHCNDNFIVMGKDVVRIDIFNKKISKLKVECPNRSCSCYIELVEMQNHLRLCSKQPLNCPYIPIGCNTKKVDKETIECHLRRDKLIHDELLIELIQNLKNEVNELKKDSAKSKLEIVNLKEEIRINKDQILILNEELKAKNNEIEFRIKVIENKQQHMEDTLFDNQTKIMEDLKKRKLEIVSLRKELQKKEDKILSIAKEMNECQLRSEDARINKENMMTMIHEVRKNVNEMKEEINRYGQQGESSMNGLCSNINEGFGWRIEKCSSKIGRALYSDSFYANNYKLCLYAGINCYDDIYVRCYIMKGDNDDKLRWPMRQTVTLSIVNQVTLGTHKSETYKYDTFKGNKSAFDKPNKDRNDWGIGLYYPLFGSFIKYSVIRNNLSIVVNDSISLRCTVNND